MLGLWDSDDDDDYYFMGLCCLFVQNIIMALNYNYTKKIAVQKNE